MLGLVRSYPQGPEAQGSPKVEACELPAFRYFHFVLRRARKDVARTLANLVEGASSVADTAGRSSTKHCMARKYQYPCGFRALRSSARTEPVSACHNASLAAADNAL